MTPDPSKAAELRVKHLEMIQGLVTRMSNQAATIKNYCITVTTAVCGFAITLQRPLVALLALLPITTFALLDTQYLRLERRFRALFDHTRSENWETLPTFEIDLNSAPQVKYWDALGSWSIVSFYTPLALAVVAVVLIAGYLYGRIL